MDFCRLQNGYAWRTMARAVRYVVALTCLSFEVFSMRDLGTALGEMNNELSSDLPYCCRCGVRKPQLVVVTADVDQAFEACHAHSVLRAWLFFWDSEAQAVSGYRPNAGRRDCTAGTAGDEKAL